MRWKLAKYSPKYYLYWGLFGLIIIWFMAGFLNTLRMDLIPSIFIGFWQGLFFGASPLWLGGVLRYIYSKYVDKKPPLVVEVYNGHLECKIVRFYNENEIQRRVNQLKYTINPEKVDLHYFPEQKTLKIDYKGGIETRTEIFTKLMNFFDTRINLEAVNT